MIENISILMRVNLLQAILVIDDLRYLANLKGNYRKKLRTQNELNRGQAK